MRLIRLGDRQEGGAKWHDAGAVRRRALREEHETIAGRDAGADVLILPPRARHAAADIDRAPQPRDNRNAWPPANLVFGDEGGLEFGAKRRISSQEEWFETNTTGSDPLAGTPITTGRAG